MSLRKKALRFFSSIPHCIFCGDCWNSFARDLKGCVFRPGAVRRRSKRKGTACETYIHDYVQVVLSLCSNLCERTHASSMNFFTDLL